MNPRRRLRATGWRVIMDGWGLSQCPRKRMRLKDRDSLEKTDELTLIFLEKEDEASTAYKASAI